MWKALNNMIPRAHTSVIRAIYPPKGNDGRNHFYYEQPRHFIENYLFVDCLNGLSYFEMLRFFHTLSHFGKDNDYYL